MGLATVKTEITGFDHLLGGGIPKGSTLLISGPPGAGKTVIALQYAFNQAKKGERVLFVSTCELLYTINKFASSMSFFDMSLIRTGVNLDFQGPREEGGFVEFWDYSLGPVLEEQYVGDIFDVIQDKVSSHRIDHLVIDSLTSINLFLGNEVERRKKLLLFMGWASRTGCTIVFTGESSAYEGAERILADGIVEMKRHEVQGREGLGVSIKTIEVVKIRGQGHSAGRYLYNISNAGVSIMAPGTGSLPHKDAAKTGIQGLDEAIAGMAYGSAWHFNIGDASLIKPFLGEMINETLRSGDGLVYVVSPNDDFSAGSFREHFGAETGLKGHVAIMDLYGRQPDEKLKDLVISAGPGEHEAAVKALMSHVCAKKRCRIFMDTGVLEERMGIEKASRTYADMLDLVRGKDILFVTFNGPVSKGSLATMVASDGVIDVWDYAGYALLQVRKAPYAKSFEPYIIKIEDGRIRIMPV